MKTKKKYFDLSAVIGFGAPIYRGLSHHMKEVADRGFPKGTDEELHREQMQNRAKRDLARHREHKLNEE